MILRNVDKYSFLRGRNGHCAEAYFPRRLSIASFPVGAIDVIKPRFDLFGRIGDDEPEEALHGRLLSVGYLKSRVQPAQHRPVARAYWENASAI
jgi:hypothetical protein